MTLPTYRTLPRECPVGFRFKWQRDDPFGRTRTYELVSWLSDGTPQFAEADGERWLWSPRLETVAAEAWEASRAHVQE